MARNRQPKSDMTAEMERKIFAKQHVLDRAEEAAKLDEAMARERKQRVEDHTRRLEAFKAEAAKQEERKRQESEKILAVLMKPSESNYVRREVIVEPNQITHHPKADVIIDHGTVQEIQVDRVVISPEDSSPTGKTQNPDEDHSAEQVNPFDLSAIIRARIKSEGWPCYALGKTCGVDPAVVQRFMSGERSIRLETAERLCSVLGLFLVPRAVDDLEGQE
jgi:ribosome-binding protein aMBF1 (putative translation factor)